MPSPRDWPSGRASVDDVGWASRLDWTELTLGCACEQAAAAVTASGVAVAVRPTARSDPEASASSGTVAVSRTELPNRWTASVNRPVRDSNQSIADHRPQANLTTVRER